MKIEPEFGGGIDRGLEPQTTLPPENMVDECGEETDAAGDATHYAHLTRRYPVLDARYGRCGAAMNDTFQLDRSLAALLATTIVEAPPTGGYDRFRAGVMFNW